MLEENRPIPLWVTVLRWIAVVPGAVGGALLARATVYISTSWFVGDHLGYVDDILLDFGVGYFMPVFAYGIAPSHRPYAAIGVGALSLLLAGASLFANLLVQDWYYLPSTLAWIAGTVYSLWSIVRETLGADA